MPSSEAVLVESRALEGEALTTRSSQQFSVYFI